MPISNSCAQCGGKLRPHQAEGLCTRCLLEGGLEAGQDRPETQFSDSSPIGIPASESAVSSAKHEAVRYFGDYELLEEIARGGMGVVYRARQTSLERIVALKMILAGQFASKQIVQRFRGEVTAAALLQHPNIVAVHDVGIHDGQHYFSMDYVEGQNLSQLVGTRPLPAAKAARYVKLVAEAIHYAHQQGILHRDLKPSNVLVDASDQPRITDFGLAKRLDGDVSLTLTGQVLGSPNFMPPEQASAQRGKVGRHSDVYGLGAILYHLLTARPPFQAESLGSVINQVLNTDPVSPRLLNSSVPLDLETICIKCLQKEPSRRYQSAQELADELNRFLRHEPIQARPITRAEGVWRWCCRNPVVAGLGAGLVLAIVTGFAGVSWQLGRVSREEAISRRNLYTSDMNRVLQTWDQGNLQLAQQLLQAHVPPAGKEDLRGFEWRYLQQLCRDESRFSFTNVQFAGDDNRLALDSEAQTLIVTDGDTLKWLDVQKRSQTQIKTIGPPGINRLAVAPGRPGLVAFHTDRFQARSPTGEALLGGGLVPGLRDAPDSNCDVKLALSWDGALLAVSGSTSMVNFDKNMVRIVDVATGQPLGPGFRLGEKEAILSLAFSPDGTHLACGTLGTKIFILEVPSLKRVKVLTGHAAGVNSLAFDSAGSKLVSAGGDRQIRVWRVPDWGLAACFSGYDNTLALSPDGLRLACGSCDHAVRVWNLARLELPPTILHGHRGAVTSVLFSRDGNELYTGSDDGTVKVWDLSSKGSSNTLRNPDWSDQICFSPDGKLIAFTDFNGHTATLWDVASRGMSGRVGEHSEPCRGVKFSPDGMLIATSGNDGTVQISDVATKRKIRVFPVLANGGEASIAFHPSKAILATGREDLRFWDLADGKRLNLLADAPTNGVETVIFSPDGKWLVLGMDKGQVGVWDFVTRRQSRSFHEHSAEARIIALCFSQNGKYLAAAGNDNLITLYEVWKGVPKRLEGHFAQVFGLAFAPDDKSLVSTSWDGTIRFWSLANYQVALKLAHDGGGVNSVAFSPDGNLMATAGADGTARLWPAASLDSTTASKKAKANLK